MPTTDPARVRPGKYGDLGRGPVATADMTARIADLRRQGHDVIDALWQRHLHAIREGYTYEYAE